MASLETTDRLAVDFSEAFARSLEAASAPSRAMLEAKAKAESEADPESEAPQLAVVPEPPAPALLRTRTKCADGLAERRVHIPHACHVCESGDRRMLAVA